MLLVEYILIIEIGLLYGWAVLERRPNHVNKRVVADIWLLTVSWTLTWEMIQIRNFYCFMYRQNIWLIEWEAIVGDMIDHVGIYGSRVAEGLWAFNVGLVLHIFDSAALSLLTSISVYTPRFNEVDRGLYWYHLVRLSVCGQNRVRSVSSTILIGSISYLHILSSNFRSCVACNTHLKVQKFEILANFLNL